LLLTGYIYFKWHTETGNTIIPPEGEAVSLYIIFKNRDSYVSEILVKEGFKINARLLQPDGKNLYSDRAELPAISDHR
jgi:hypothetical protein